MSGPITSEGWGPREFLVDIALAEAIMKAIDERLTCAGSSSAVTLKDFVNVRWVARYVSGPGAESSVIINRTHPLAQKFALCLLFYSQFLHSRNQGCAIDAQSRGSSLGTTHPSW